MSTDSLSVGRQRRLLTIKSRSAVIRAPTPAVDEIRTIREGAHPLDSARGRLLWRSWPFVFQHRHKWGFDDVSLSIPCSATHKRGREWPGEKGASLLRTLSPPTPNTPPPPPNRQSSLP